jgi:hypothetical protein
LPRTPAADLHADFHVDAFSDSGAPQVVLACFA